MPFSDISRRNLMSTGLFAFAASGTKLNASAVPASVVPSAAGFEESLDAAYTFLDTMMDAYAAGQTVRLSQSYSDQGGLESSGFAYDNAVVIHAYLARGLSEDIARAAILGNGLLEAQKTNFPVNDGRFAQAYFTNAPDSSGAFVTPAAFPFYFYGSAVGDQCWAGMALAQLYKKTGNNAFLDGAVKAGNWVANNTYSTLGPGGFSFGTIINSSNQSQPSPNGKSTEHNIDAFAFFTMLAKLTGGKSQSGMTWSSLAQHALLFVQAMFNPAGGFFYTGTNADQITTATSIIPEDVQTWSYLALLNKAYSVSIDWVLTHLTTIDTPSCPNSALSTLGNIRIEGETFDTASLAANPSASDPHAVWLEGTAHTVAALFARRNEDVSDCANGRMQLENLVIAQQNLGKGQTVNKAAITPGKGLVAATGNLDTGFGYSYFPNLHIGATGWYALAALGADPFQLAYGH